MAMLSRRMALTQDPGAASKDDALTAAVDGDDDVEGDDAGAVDSDADDDVAARTDSPLWMVSQSPALNELVAMLQRSRDALIEGGGTGTLRFSRAQVAQARAEFVAMIRRGERDPHRLAGLLADAVLVQWGGRMFEIQVQPLSNFLLERERLTKESHASFKDTRDRVRDEVGSKVPLFSFYQRLLRWLFVEQNGDPPLHEGVEVVVVD